MRDAHGSVLVPWIGGIPFQPWVEEQLRDHEKSELVFMIRRASPSKSPARTALIRRSHAFLRQVAAALHPLQDAGGINVGPTTPAGVSMRWRGKDVEDDGSKPGAGRRRVGKRYTFRMSDEHYQVIERAARLCESSSAAEGLRFILERFDPDRQTLLGLEAITDLSGADALRYIEQLQRDAEEALILARTAEDTMAALGGAE